MALILFNCRGGSLVLPDRQQVLVDRQDGGNLVVNPPREVWERSELEADELLHWSMLVAAAGRAMIDSLPQLANGCVNYWEAGNWALNEAAEPPGAKTAQRYRRVHLHLLGRSPGAASTHHRWGEAPMFPLFADRLQWAAAHQRLTASECAAVVSRTAALLRGKYAFVDADIRPWQACPRCAYPTSLAVAGDCDGCAASS